MNLGTTIPCKGFFTKAHWLRMQTAAEVERRIGYRAGRLSQGWYLLFLLQKPTPDQFEFRGYSYMSNGIPFGHLPNPPDPRNAEQRLHQGGYDTARMKQGIIQNVFTLSGHNRLAKVIPARGEFGKLDYPPGSGIEQWTLTVPLPFQVASFIAPGEVYQGNYT